MKDLFGLLIIGFLGCNSSQPSATIPAPLSTEVAAESCPMPVRDPPGVAWDVRFSPKGGVTPFIVESINAATNSIYVQAYSFTSAPIALALVAKRKEGKTVVALLDKSNLTGKGTQIRILIDGGVTVLIDDKHAIAHNKIIIIDKKIVFTGSFNFTNAGENSNAENSIKLTDAKVAKAYQDNWNVHKEHSTLQK